VTGVACPLCGRPTRRRFIRPPWEVRRCDGCIVELTVGEWSPARAQAFYGADYFVGHGDAGYVDYPSLESALRRTARRRLSQLPRGVRLLDVGCATGGFLREAQHVDRVVGTDISWDACRRVAGRGITAVVTDAGTLPFAAASFDVVTMWDTIEHLGDPRAGLAEVARVLRPGGLLALTTGDVDSWCRRLSGKRWHLYNLPEHRFFFSAAALTTMLKEAGLRPVRCRREGAWYPLSYLVERLAKTLLGSLPVAGGATRTAFLRDTMVYVNLFDILNVHAVKSAGAPGA
jgi:SAM-dependent methyltransferase